MTGLTTVMRCACTNCDRTFNAKQRNWVLMNRNMGVMPLPLCDDCLKEYTDSQVDEHGDMT